MRWVSSFSTPPRRGHRGIGKPQRIGAVFVDDLQRVDDVAKRFRHLLALGVADKAVQVDGVERHLIHHGQLHHHHPGDPEEQDIRPVTRTEVGKYFCSSGVGSGQPSVPMGQRPEENQVSRTSGSRQNRIGQLRRSD